VAERPLGGTNDRAARLGHPLLDGDGNCLIVLEEDRGDVAAGETVLVEPF